MRRASLFLWPVVAASLAGHFFEARPAGATATDVLVGANLTNEPYKLTAAEQETMLGAIEQAGVHVIRASVPSNDAGIDFAARAYAHGIKIELLLWLYPVAGTQWPHAPKGFQ